MAESGDNAPEASDLLVIFGITGDLARKMTFRALYRLERRELLQCPIVGVASDDLTIEELVNRARKAIVDSGEKLDDKVFDRLAGRLSYLHGDVTDDALYDSLAKHIGSKRTLYYLEMPPSLFAPIVESLGKAGLVQQSRVALEKPFGHDLASAQELNNRLHAVLDEDQILRVDHFLGKQPVVELEYLRFGNLALAELWDRNSISEIQITMAEDFGVQDRGRFYDAVGALRDVVQNHLLQVLALTTMEPPVGPSADDLNDKKAEVFRAMPAVDPNRYVRGQYAAIPTSTGLPATHRPRPSSRCGWRSTTGAGPVCRSSCGRARRCRRGSPKCGCYSPRTPRLAFLPDCRAGRSQSDRACASIQIPDCACS